MIIQIQLIIEIYKILILWIQLISYGKNDFLKQDANLTNISSNKGFFLHPDFENKLNSLHTFDCSYYLSSSPSTIGEFFIIQLFHIS